jgi:hypothetical protein
MESVAHIYPWDFYLEAGLNPDAIKDCVSYDDARRLSITSQQWNKEGKIDDSDYT